MHSPILFYKSFVFLFCFVSGGEGGLYSLAQVLLGSNVSNEGEIEQELFPPPRCPLAGT